MIYWLIIGLIYWLKDRFIDSVMESWRVMWPRLLQGPADRGEGSGRTVPSFRTGQRGFVCHQESGFWLVQGSPSGGGRGSTGEHLGKSKVKVRKSSLYKLFTRLVIVSFISVCKLQAFFFGVFFLFGDFYKKSAGKVWFTVNKQSDEVRLDIFFRPLWVKVTSRSSWPCWMTTCLKDRKWTLLLAQARSRTQRQHKVKTAKRLMRTQQLVSITNHWVK